MALTKTARRTDSLRIRKTVTGTAANPRLSVYEVTKKYTLK